MTVTAVGEVRSGTRNAVIDLGPAAGPDAAGAWLGVLALGGGAALLRAGENSPGLQ